MLFTHSTTGTLSIQGASPEGTGNAITTTFDLVNQRLGVGTTTPGSILSLNNVANFTAATTTFYSTGGINLTSGCFSVGGVCVGSTAASSTLLSDNNTFSGINNFSNASSVFAGNAGSATKLATARTINGVSFDGSSNITINAASSTLLSDNNSFSGKNTFASATSSSFAITGLANSLLSVNASGSVIATSSIGTNLLTGTLGTINGTPFSAGSSITVGSASTTLLSDNNTFSGSNIFSQPLSLTSTTGTTTLGNGQGFAIGTSKFVVQGATGNVGIGTTTPQSLLTISGTTPGNTVSMDNGGTIVSPLNYSQLVDNPSTPGNNSAYANLLLYTQANATNGTASHYGIWDQTSDVAGNTSNQTQITSFEGVARHLSSQNLTSLQGAAIFANNRGSGTTVINETGALITANSNNSTGATTTTMYGLDAQTANSSAYGGATTQADIHALTTVGSNVQTANSYGLLLDNLSNAGTIGNTYGIYVGSMTAGTQTNHPFSFYASDTSAYNYFGGNVGIGTTTPGSILSLGGIANFTTATSTFYSTGGINLAGGCYAINGSCLGLGSFSGTLGIGNGGTNATSYTPGTLLSYNGTSFVSTSTIGNNQLANSSLTVNGTSIGLGSSGTITAASSTLLANNNTFSGTDTFSNPITGSVTGNAGTVTNGVYTTTFNGLFDPRFVTDLAATTSVNSITTLNNLSLPYSQITGAPTTAASSTLLSDNNTFTGKNTFASATSSSFAITGLANSLLSVNANGSVTTTVVSGPLSFSGNTLSISQANASTNGFLASADWTTFNNKISSTSLSATYPLAYNSSTGNFSLGFGTTTSNTWAGTQTFTNTIVGSINGNANTATALQTARTINGVSFDGSANITINAASSTLLANNNTFSGTNTFSNPITGSVTGNAGTVTNGVYTTTFNNLFDNRLSASSSISGITTLPNLSLPYSQITGAPTTAASSTLLSDNNTFSGSNIFSSLLKLNGGLTAFASSTIGSGGANGLTINGNSTTTANAFVGGNLNVGTQSAISSGIGLNVLGNNSGQNVGGNFQNSNAGGYSGFNLYDAAGTLAGTVQYANASAGTLPNSFIIGSRNGTAPIDFVTSAGLGVQATLLANGNFGVGTTTPGSVFSVAGVTNFTTATSTFFGTGGINLTNGGCYAVNGNCIVTNGASSTLLSDNNTFSGNNIFSKALNLSGTTGTTTIAVGQGFTIGGSQFVVQQGSGNVGIGTTSPATTLSVAGSGYLTGGLGVGALNNAAGTILQQTATQFTGYTLSNATNNIVKIYGTTGTNDAPVLQMMSGGTTNVQIGTGNGIATYFNSGQNFGIGTTTPGSLLSLNGIANFVANSTSTLYKGLNLTSGCFAIGGNCLSLSNIGGTLGIANGGTNATSYTTGTLLSFNGTSFVSTSTIGNNQLANSSITVNGTSISLGGSSTITAASSTLLANNNTFSGSNIFSSLLSLNNGFISNASSTIVGNATITGTGTFGSNLTVNGTGTSTFAGNLTIGSANSNYYPNAPLVLTTNTNNYGQLVLQNLNGGSNASADLIFGGNLMNNNAYYGDLGFNSSTNSGPFNPNATYLYSSDGDLDLATASTTGNMNFFAGGTANSNIALTIGNNGNVGIGSSTPNNLLSIAGGDIFQTAGAPTLASSTTLTNQGRGVAIAGRYAYVAEVAGVNNLEIFDVQNPNAPVRVGQVTLAGLDTGNPIVSGNYLFVGISSPAQVQIFDISNPSNPTLVESLLTVTPTRSIALSGRYLYVGGNAALKIYDISNITAPALESTTLVDSNMALTNAIALQGSYAFVVGSSTTAASSRVGMQIFDVSNPQAPSAVSSYATQGSGSAVTVSGRYAYIGEPNYGSTIGGVETVDISNPSAPTQTSFFTTSSTSGLTTAPMTLPMAGQYLYFNGTAASNSFQVIDVTNPAAPVSVATINAGGSLGMQVVGKYAYTLIAATPNSLKIYDISGANLPAANVGSFSADLLNVNQSATFAQNLYVNGGINAGLQGIFSRGGLGVFVGSTTAANPVAAEFMGGNVGIGTSTPWGQLSIANTGSNPAFNISNASSTATQFIVNSAGNVGIGLSTPSTTLQAIASSTGILDNLYIGNSAIAANGNGTALIFGANSGVNAQNEYGRIQSIVTNDAANFFSGDLQFFTTNNKVSSEKLRLTAAGNLGIGTTTPGSIFSVAGVTNFTTATSTFFGTGGLNLTNGGCYAVNGTCIVTNGASSTLLSDNSTFSGTNDFTGLLGFGTTSPQATIDIGGKISSTIGFGINAPTVIAGASTNNSTGFEAYNTGTIGSSNFNIVDTTNHTFRMTQFDTSAAGTTFGLSNATTDYLVNSGGTARDLAIGTQNSSNLIFGTNSAERLRILSSGNVGIGTTTPGSIFSVAGVTNFTAATSTFYSTGGINLANGGCYAVNGTCIGSTAASSTLLTDNNTFSGSNIFSQPLNLSATTGTTTIAAGQGFTVAGSQLVVQQGSGNVGIGTSTPNANFVLNGTVTSPSGNIAQVSTSTNQGILIINKNGFLGVGTSTPGSILSVGGVANFSNATSTFLSTGGINLASGCFSIGGTCIGTNAASSTLLINNNTFSGSNAFSGNTTLANATSTNFFSTTASSTNLFSQSASFGSLSLGSGTTTAGNGINITSGCFSVNGSCITGGLSYAFSNGVTNTSGTVTNDLSTGVAGGQSVVGGTNANDSLTLVSNNSGTPGNIYFGSAHQAWYNANQTFFQIESPNQGATAATTSGIFMQNATAATASIQQSSPSIVLEGQGWGTTAGTSQYADWQLYNLPVAGTVPSTNLLFQSNVNTTAFTTRMTLTSAGVLEPTYLEVAAGSLGSTNTTNGALWVPSPTASVHEALAQYSFATSSSNAVGLRTGFYGSVGTVLTVGDNYAAVDFAGTPVTLAASGVHNWLTAIAVKPTYVIGTGAAKVWNTATLYIDGASTSTVNGLNYDIYASSTAPSFFGGSIGIGTTSPVVAADVYGDVRVGTTGTNGCIQNFAGTGLAGTCSSDARLKNVNNTITNTLAGISDLSLVNFHWNDIAGTLYHNSQTATNTGFIAQNVQQEFPQLVTVDSNGYDQVDYTDLNLYGIEATKELNSVFNASNASTTQPSILSLLCRYLDSRGHDRCLG